MPRLLPCLALLALLACLPARAGDASVPPRVRLCLELGMHLGVVEWADADASGRLLLTVGTDDVRLWDVARGRLLRVIRPGISPRFAALAPDGALIAVKDHGGIALYDAVTGSLQRRFSHGQAPCRFSPDGQLLIAADGKVLHTADGSAAATIETSPLGLYCVAFDARGRLAAGFRDGWIRLYDSRGVLLATTQFADRGTVSAVSFNPDSSLLAAGFQLGPGEILSGDTLARKHTLDGHAAAVAWGTDGRTLLGWGGEFRLWETRDWNPIARVSAGEGYCQNLMALRSGGFAYAGHAWGVLSASGEL